MDADTAYAFGDDDVAFEQAYEDGAAAADGKSPYDAVECPYEEGHELRETWLLGYRQTISREWH